MFEFLRKTKVVLNIAEGTFFYLALQGSKRGCLETEWSADEICSAPVKVTAVSINLLEVLCSVNTHHGY